MVCKTIQDGSNPSVHLRSGVNGQHAGLWILRYRFKSGDRCASFVQWKGQRISNPPIRVRILYEAYGHVAKRLCIGLLNRKTQVRLLSCPLRALRTTNTCPRRLKDRPGGYGPSDARSTRAGDAVAVADMVMQRIVVPPYAGSSPVSHLHTTLHTTGENNQAQESRPNFGTA